jgi:cytochrome c
MDSLELNKAAAAVLLAGIAFVGSGLLGKALVDPEIPAKVHIAVAEPEGATAVAAAPAPVPISVLLVSANAKEGEAQTKQQGCVACHTFNKGGKAGIGPNLYGVVGGPHGHMEGYDYSSALKSKKGPWTFAELNEWLTKPSAYAPGTKMTFAGLPDAKKRADIIEYLRENADNPVPKPKPTTAELAEATKPPPGAKPGVEPIDVRLASADPKAGEADTKKLGCVACHTFTEGGRAGVGPNLYNVVGGPHAHMQGYDYSSALKAKTGPWTYAALDQWLTNPANYAPGTKMTFAGIPNPKERADVIDYLRTLSKNPEPLPAKK